MSVGKCKAIEGKGMSDMTYDEAKDLLNTCKREEIPLSLGDKYIQWYVNDKTYIAVCYFNESEDCMVNFMGNNQKFYGAIADKLRGCGTLI